MHKKLAGVSDIEKCIEHCSDDRLLSVEERRLQMEMLLTLMRQNAAIAWVVEEFCVPGHLRQPLGFGFSMGVDEACVQRYLESPTGSWTAYLLHAWRENPQVVLSEKQLLAAHQSEQGIVLNCYWGWRTGVPEPQRYELFWCLWLAYRVLHMGYHLRAHIQEVPCESLGMFLSDRIGHTLIRHPSSRTSRAPLAHSHGLIYTSRADAEARPEYPVWYFFHHRAPWLALPAQCLRVVQCAQLFGFSNQQIASLLNLSASTVGTYWEQMYHKTHDNPHCGEVFSGSSFANSRRGEERRRRFLQYLQYQPSIARPILLGSVALDFDKSEKLWY